MGVTIRTLVVRHGSTQSMRGGTTGTIRALKATSRAPTGTIRALWGWLFGSLRGLLGGDYKGSTGDYLGVSATGHDCRRLVIPGRWGCFGVV